MVCENGLKSISIHTFDFTEDFPKQKLGIPISTVYICSMFVRIIAIWFLALYAMSSPLGAQLMKIPIFIEHYREHQSQAPQISLLEFVQMHYFKKQHDGGDFQRDMQLPFKSISPNAMNFVCLIRATILPVDAAIQQDLASLKFPVFQEQLVSLGNFNTIWQPPRTA